jgi:rhamnogalacturonan endolyase
MWKGIGNEGVINPYMLLKPIQRDSSGWWPFTCTLFSLSPFIKTFCCMKKVSTLLFIFFFISALQQLAAQTASATWPLTSSATVNGTASGAITAAREIVGPGFSSPSYNSRTIAGTSTSVSTQNITVNPGGVGTSSATAHANGGFVQFAITPHDGYDFTVETISFYMGSGNANSNGTSIEYSFNPDFSSPVILGTPGGSSAFPSRDVLYPFSFSPSGLEVKAGQTFYLRIYAWNGSTTARLLLLNNLVIAGEMSTSKPTVKTTAVSNITPTSATTGGDVISDAGNAVTERGVVYGTTANPTTDNTRIVDASGGTGSYTATLTGLADYTTYHVRAYATSSAGTAYGANVTFTTPSAPDEVVTTPRQMEKLDRGLVAVRTTTDQVYVGWRLFGTDPAGISFNIYRNGVKINDAPVTGATNYVDHTAEDGAYTIRPVMDGVEQRASRQAAVWAQNYLNIPLQKPAGGTTPDGVAYTYTANDVSVGDLDGDGEYEIILKWDPTNAKDNSQSGYTGNVYLDAYKLNGTRLWRIDLGKNIRAGAHYTQFMVYDLDGDGKAELACKTADGTVDGAGVIIGNADADYRNSGGYILSGPEFLTIFNGETGAAMATTAYLPARGNVGSWGDTYGNRVDRFIAAVAYLDGARPSLIMGRGYYTRQVRAAWDWRDGKLTLRWIFDSNDPGNSSYNGQGNHQMTIGDVDGDGKQEVFNGSSAINDNGRRLWANGLGHGDALHMTDMDPDRPGQEIWMPYETPAGNGGVGAALLDAKTGTPIFTVPEAKDDVGRGLAADIDPRHKGYEMWASRGGLYNAKGEQIGTTKPSINFAIWWDGDLSRELLDGTTIQKWEYLTSTRTTLLSPAGVSSNNGTKATPALSADLFGDWREEVIFRTSDDNNLRIYTTTIPTEHRLYTLMHDPQYRVAIAWQNSAYNQPPHPGFYLGTDMEAAPVPDIEYVKDVIPPVALAKNITVALKGGEVSISAEEVDAGSYDAFEIGSLEISKSTFDCSNIGENEVTLTVTDKNGNKATATAMVTVVGSVPAKPQITVSRTDNTYTGADEKTIFLGYGAQQLTLTAVTPDEGATTAYQWSPAVALNAVDVATPVFSPTTAGTFTYNVTVTNQYGCTAASDPVVLNVVDVRCGDNSGKVIICHSKAVNHQNSKDICIEAASVQEHLAHGCRLGSCSNGTTAITILVAEKDIENGHDNAGISLQVYPNPLNTMASVSMTFARAGKYTLALHDTKGTLIRLLSRGENARQLFYEFQTGSLAKGVYFIRLLTETGVVTKRVVVQ